MKGYAILLACIVNALLVWGLVLALEMKKIPTHELTMSVHWLPANTLDAPAGTAEESAALSIIKPASKGRAEPLATKVVPTNPLDADVQQKQHNATAIAAQKNAMKPIIAPSVLNGQNAARAKGRDHLLKAPIVKNRPDKPQQVGNKPKPFVLRSQAHQLQSAQKNSTPQPHVAAAGNSNQTRAAGFSQGSNMAAVVSGLNKCYPKIAQKRGEEGVAQVVAVIGPKDNIESVFITQSTGYKRLDDCALSAVKGARFKSALKDGVPITSRMTLPPIRFAIQR